MNQSISNHQSTLKKCEKLLSPFFLSLSPWWSQLKSASLLLLSRLATRGSHAGNLFKVAYNELCTNDRLFVGVMFGFAGVLLYEAHLLFINPELPSVFAFIPDPMVSKQEFYYKAWYWYFFTMRQEYLLLFFLTGLFLILPTKWGYRWFLVPVLAAVFFETVYQSFFIDDWKDFHTTPWAEILAIVVVSIYPIYKGLDYIAYRHYHLKAGSKARLFIIKTPGVSLEQKVEKYEETVNEIFNYNARV